MKIALNKKKVKKAKVFIESVGKSMKKYQEGAPKRRQKQIQRLKDEVRIAKLQAQKGKLQKSIPTNTIAGLSMEYDGGEMFRTKSKKKGYDQWRI